MSLFSIVDSGFAFEYIRSNVENVNPDPWTKNTNQTNSGFASWKLLPTLPGGTDEADATCVGGQLGSTLARHTVRRVKHGATCKKFQFSSGFSTTFLERKCMQLQSSMIFKSSIYIKSFNYLFAYIKQLFYWLINQPKILAHVIFLNLLIIRQKHVFKLDF